MVLDDVPVDLPEDIESDELNSEQRMKLAQIWAATVDRSDFDLPATADIDPIWGEYDRPRGVFTKQDREYLRTPFDHEGQEERNIRYRIRKRLIQTFNDASYLTLLDQDDLEATLESIGPGAPHLAIELYTFALRSLRTAIANESEFRDSMYERAMERAIEEVEDSVWANSRDPESAEGSRLLVTASVDVDIERREFEGQKLGEKILEGNATQGEFDEFWDRGARRGLIREAEEQGMSEIAVTGTGGVTVTYDIDDLKEDLKSKEAEFPAKVFLKGIRHMVNEE